MLKPAPENQYLEFLGLTSEVPSFDFLRRLVKAHLAKVPYENVSKLIHFKKFGPTIPNFEEYIHQLIESGFGGTCFSQNIYLNQLLKFLGFDSQLVSVRRNDQISHVNIRVAIDGNNYFVDVGIMSSVAGPYLIQADATFDRWVGNQRFVFKPSDDLSNYTLEIYREEKVIRTFQSSPLPFSKEDLAMGIRNTFEHGAMFMTTLCVHRAYSDHSVGLWNRQFYRIEGTSMVKREITSVNGLESVFRDELKVPSYP